MKTENLWLAKLAESAPQAELAPELPFQHLRYDSQVSPRLDDLMMKVAGAEQLGRDLARAEAAIGMEKQALMAQGIAGIGKALAGGSKGVASFGRQAAGTMMKSPGVAGAAMGGAAGAGVGLLKDPGYDAQGNKKSRLGAAAKGALGGAAIGGAAGTFLKPVRGAIQNQGKLMSQEMRAAGSKVPLKPGGAFGATAEQSGAARAKWNEMAAAKGRSPTAGSLGEGKPPGVTINTPAHPAANVPGQQLDLFGGKPASTVPAGTTSKPQAPVVIHPGQQYSQTATSMGGAGSAPVRSTAGEGAVSTGGNRKLLDPGSWRSGNSPSQRQQLGEQSALSKEHGTKYKQDVKAHATAERQSQQGGFQMGKKASHLRHVDLIKTAVSEKFVRGLTRRGIPKASPERVQRFMRNLGRYAEDLPTSLRSPAADANHARVRELAFAGREEGRRSRSAIDYFKSGDFQSHLNKMAGFFDGKAAPTEAHAASADHAAYGRALTENAATSAHSKGKSLRPFELPAHLRPGRTTPIPEGGLNLGGSAKGLHVPAGLGTAARSTEASSLHALPQMARKLRFAA